MISAVCLSVCLLVCLSVCLSVCLPVSLSVQTLKNNVSDEASDRGSVQGKIPVYVKMSATLTSAQVLWAGPVLRYPADISVKLPSQSEMISYPYRVVMFIVLCVFPCEPLCRTNTER